MTMKFYRVTVEGPAGRRDFRVPSPTDVQAADAASPLLRTGEAIVSMDQVEDDGTQQADALPPRTQAEEAAALTPGAASVDTDRT